MASEEFQIGESIGFGWQMMKETIGFFFVALLIAGVVVAIPGGFEGLGYKHPVSAAILGFLVLLVSILLSLGFIRVTLRVCDGEKPGFADLFRFGKVFWKYIAGTIIYALIVLVGLILLIVPGIYWGIKYMFYAYLIVDEDLGPIEAIKKSGEITQGSKGTLFWLAIVCYLVLLLGLICCGVGLFLAIPTVLLAIAFAYRRLMGQSEVGVPGHSLASEEIGSQQ